MESSGILPTKSVFREISFHVFMLTFEFDPIFPKNQTAPHPIFREI